MSHRGEFCKQHYDADQQCRVKAGGRHDRSGRRGVPIAGITATLSVSSVYDEGRDIFSDQRPQFLGGGPHLTPIAC